MISPNWWPPAIVFMGLSAIALQALEQDEFDPASLPPPAAGIVPEKSQPQQGCEGVVYSISKDGIKYVREAGGGVMLAAELGSSVGFFQIGEYNSLEYPGRTRMESSDPSRLEYALTHCNAEYLPSGLNFSYR
jgi:hypothetical protein